MMIYLSVTSDLNNKVIIYTYYVIKKLIKFNKMLTNVFKNSKDEDILPCEALVQYIEQHTYAPSNCSSTKYLEAFTTHVNALHKLCVLQKEIKDSKRSYTYDDLFRPNKDLNIIKNIKNTIKNDDTKVLKDIKEDIKKHSDAIDYLRDSIDTVKDNMKKL